MQPHVMGAQHTTHPPTASTNTSARLPPVSTSMSDGDHATWSKRAAALNLSKLPTVTVAGSGDKATIHHVPVCVPAEHRFDTRHRLLVTAFEHILACGLDSEGLFRCEGVSSRVERALGMLLRGDALNAEVVHANDVCFAMKRIFRQLSPPLFDAIEVRDGRFA